MPCHSLDTLLEDPHLAAVGLLGWQDHPVEGPVRTVRPTILADGVAPGGMGFAPPLGWDTEAVLVEAGFTAAEVAALAANGAVRIAPGVAPGLRDGVQSAT